MGSTTWHFPTMKKTGKIYIYIYLYTHFLLGQVCFGLIVVSKLIVPWKSYDNNLFNILNSDFPMNGL